MLRWAGFTDTAAGIEHFQDERAASGRLVGYGIPEWPWNAYGCA